MANIVRSLMRRFRGFQRHQRSERQRAAGPVPVPRVARAPAYAPPPPWPGHDLDPTRPVGEESRKSYAAKIASGFFARYLAGDNILEIGFRGGGGDSVASIVPAAIGIDVDYPGYDGVRLPFADGSQDAIYTSHCLEHISDYRGALRDWFRVLKVGGFLVIVVPHQWLFERKRTLPSRWNPDHKRFYTPASLLAEIERVLAPNTYRIRHLIDNDAGFNYDCGPLGHGSGCFEIELVVEKLPPPTWDMDDGASRYYSADEFYSNLSKLNPSYIETDFTGPEGCLVFGPYVSMAPGVYDATFYLEAIGLGAGPMESKIIVDVNQGVHTQLGLITLAGVDGANILREGKVTVRFTNKSPDRVVEFRLFAYGRPYTGRLRFCGVRLWYVWPV